MTGDNIPAMQPISDPTAHEQMMTAAGHWLTCSTYELLGSGCVLLNSELSLIRLGLVHSRRANSTAVINKSPQNANRARLSGRRLANATPAEIAAMPPSASGKPTSQSTLPASA